MISAEKALLNARCRVLVKQPWYGTIASRFKWQEDSNVVDTMGVCVLSGGKVLCAYNNDFVRNLPVDQLVAVICHEIEHIIRLHCIRDRFLNDWYSKTLWNIACDWVINGKKDHKRIEDLPDNGTFIPDHNNKNDQKIWGIMNNGKLDYSCLYEIDDKWIAEEFFVWLKKYTKTNRSGGREQVVALNGTVIDTKTLDDHGVWSRSTASNEDIRTTAKELACTASARTAGKIPGGLEEAINKLFEPQNNWMFKFRHLIGRAAGNKRKTYFRRNRRIKKFGIKGYSRHASVSLLIGVDTSGSMSQKMLQRVFSEVEAMSQHFKITLVEFDTHIRHISEYHKGDWKKIKIHGRGGTDFAKFFDGIENEGLIGKMNLIITDGFDALPEERDYPVTWVVIGRKGTEYLKSQGELWGDVVLIEHDYEEAA